MNKQEFRAAASIGLLYIIRMMGLFMVLPVLPLLGPELKAATPALIGVALGAYGLSQACLQIPLGLLSDRIGRKPVVLGGLSLLVIGSVIAGLSDTIYGVIAGRFLQGCGAVASALLALMSDLTRVDQRSKSMAIIGISIGSSFAISLIVGPLISNHFGLSGVFYFAALAGLLGMAVVIGVIPTPRIQSRNMESTVALSRIGDVIRNTMLLRADISIFLVHYMLMSSFIAFPLFMKGTGVIQDEDHHFVYLGLLVGSFILMGPLMWLSDRRDYTRRMLVSMIGMLAVSLVMLANFSGVYGVLSAMLLFFMSFNLLEVIMPALVSKISPAGARGTAMGVYSTSQFLGAFAGGTAGGFIISLSDISHLMYVNAALCVLWFAIGMTMKKPADVGSRTVQIPDDSELTANEMWEALSSVAGVLDVVVIEEDKVAYLKVDNHRFDDESLTKLGDSLHDFAT